MRTFIPSQSFTGYPDGKTPVRFKAGQESPAVPEPFVQLMFEKGLVDEKRTQRRATAPIRAPRPAVARKIAAATKSRRSGKASGQANETSGEG